MGKANELLASRQPRAKESPTLALGDCWPGCLRKTTVRDFSTNAPRVSLDKQESLVDIKVLTLL